MSGFCGKCGAKRNEGAKFCGGCGAAFPATPVAPAPPTCAGCGKPSKPGAAFCGLCGQPTGQAPAQSASVPAPTQAVAPAPTPERAPATRRADPPAVSPSLLETFHPAQSAAVSPPVVGTESPQPIDPNMTILRPTRATPAPGGTIAAPAPAAVGSNRQAEPAPIEHDAVADPESQASEPERSELAAEPVNEAAPAPTPATAIQCAACDAHLMAGAHYCAMCAYPTERAVAVPAGEAPAISDSQPPRRCRAVPHRAATK